jgi:hypothetical protein
MIAKEDRAVYTRLIKVLGFELNDIKVGVKEVRIADKEAPEVVKVTSEAEFWEMCEDIREVARQIVLRRIRQMPATNKAVKARGSKTEYRGFKCDCEHCFECTLSDCYYNGPSTKREQKMLLAGVGDIRYEGSRKRNKI